MPRNLKKHAYLKFLSASFGFIILTNAYAGEQVATVIAVSGNATAGGRALSRASAIFQGETVATQAGGKVKFRFTDGSIIALAEKSSYVIKNYSFNNASKQNTFESKLLKGGLKTITGKIGKDAARTEEAIAAGIPKDQVSKNADYKMQAGVASIGVRGTSGKVALDPPISPLFGLDFLKPPPRSFDDTGLVTAVSCTDGTMLVADAVGEVTVIGEGGESNYVEVSPAGTEILSYDGTAGLDTEPDDDGGGDDGGGDDGGGDDGGGDTVDLDQSDGDDTVLDVDAGD